MLNMFLNNMLVMNKGVKLNFTAFAGDNFMDRKTYVVVLFYHFVHWN